MNPRVSRTSDAFPRCIAKSAVYAEHYKAPRFESKINRQGHHHTSGYRPKQDGAWEAPKNVHLFPASHRVGISLTPSRGSRVHHDLEHLAATSTDSSSRRATGGLRSIHDQFHDMHETGHHEKQTNIHDGRPATIGAALLRKFFSFLLPRERCVGVRQPHPAVAKPPEGDRIERRPPAGVLGGGLQPPTPASQHDAVSGWILNPRLTAGCCEAGRIGGGRHA